MSFFSPSTFLEAVHLKVWVSLELKKSKKVSKRDKRVKSAPTAPPPLEGEVLDLAPPFVFSFLLFKVNVHRTSFVKLISKEGFDSD